MADEKNKDQNQDSQRNEKAMGATATGAQGQPGGQQNTGSKPQESAGQGGGVQGTGQRNPAQGQDKGNQTGDRGEDFKPTGGGARQGDGDVWLGAIRLASNQESGHFCPPLFLWGCRLFLDGSDATEVAVSAESFTGTLGHAFCFGKSPHEVFAQYFFYVLLTISAFK